MDRKRILENFLQALQLPFFVFRAPLQKKSALIKNLVRALTYSKILLTVARQFLNFTRFIVLNSNKADYTLKTEKNKQFCLLITVFVKYRQKGAKMQDFLCA